MSFGLMGETRSGHGNGIPLPVILSPASLISCSCILEGLLCFSRIFLRK
jgi:hypothetical protein